MDYNISRFLFYDAMSAPLKKLLSIESHTIVHYGPTSKGKTAQENLISSTFGDPKQLEVLAGSTKNGIIAHVAGMNDIPVDLEEATVPEARKNIADAIYDIANGKEKNRCKSDSSLRDDIKTFRTTVHVTCENPLRENLINAGGAYRMGQVGDLLPEGLGKIVSDMKRQIQKNYGHFYPLYIQHIIKNMGTVEDLYEEALLKIDTDCDLSKEMKGIVERSKAIYACTLVAGWLTEEVFKEISLPHKSKEEVTEIVNHYFKECVIGEPVEPDWVRALKLTNDWITTDRNKFATFDNNFPYGEIYGEIAPDFIKIIGSEFTRKMKEYEFSPTAIKKAFYENGISECNSSRKNGDCNFSINNKNLIGIKIKTTVMEKTLKIKEEYNEALDVLDIAQALCRVKGSANIDILNEIFGHDVKDHLKYLMKEGKLIHLGNSEYM